MSLYTADFAKARQTAERVLREQNILRPPVLPREIAESYQLKIELVRLTSDMDKVSGFLDFSENTIYVNAADSFNRQTFTIAHELGHHLLHRRYYESHSTDYKVLLRMPIGAETDPMEKEANAFAADLLVPRKFLDIYSKYADIDELADLFAVSRDVLRYRLKFGKESQPV